MTLACVSGTGAGIAYAQQSETYGMKTNHNYLVSIKAWGNGCGKSTLFSLMTKNLYPRKGNIFLKGKNIQNLNLKEFARKVAIVQQYNSASDDITVENLVAFGRTPHKKMMQGDSAEDERMIQWALEVTNLTEYRDREVSRLSGGQRQRVWIANVRFTRSLNKNFNGVSGTEDCKEITE